MLPSASITCASFWHGVLGLLGCIPGPIGAIANFIDCAIYLFQGDYFGAALCFMNGVTMGATTVASTLLKAGKLCGVANTALRVAMVSERIAGGLTFAQNFYNIGQTGIQMYCKYGIMGESLGLDTVGEVLGIGLSAMGCIGGLHDMGNTSKELLALQKKAEAGMLCFVAGTKVKTTDGDKNIEDIEVGDEVWSCNVETGETGGKHVTRLSVNEFSDIAHVTIDGETIDATTTHPFYVEGYGFKPAGQLLVGEKVRLLDGGTGEVEAVTVEHLDEPVKVYNFEVEDWHTYYVAEQGVLVHNEGCDLDWDAVVSKRGETRQAHVLRHESNDLSKSDHGVFYGDSVSTINKAWENRGNGYIIFEDHADLYIIPYQNAGYAGGYGGQGNNLNYVTIVTQKGTNNIITGFPGNGYKYTIEGLIGGE